MTRPFHFNSKATGLLFVIVISLVFVFYFYAGVLLNPNKFLFSENGDAIKNYYTYSAHIKDQGVINSSIMNYPYGENFLYLDCHPLFTLVIKALAVPFPSVTDYSIGIINFLMIFSYVISSILLYLILLHLKVNKWYAAIGALSIAILSPQIYRIYGHFALSYSFMIPLTWYLFIRYTKTAQALKWSLIILINNLLWYLIHGYMGMIAVSFIAICYLSNLIIYESHEIRKLKTWLYFVLQVIAPLLLFWIFITFSDIHTGRNKTPYGILQYVANFFSVFIPNKEPFKEYFQKFITQEPDWEGWSYIGLASSFMILVFLLNNLLKLLKLNFIHDRSMFTNRSMIPALISSVLLLLLSMGYPFKLGMEYLLDYVKVINNFRAIGRFAWVFYYVITVWAIYYAWQFFESRKKLKPIWAVVILIIPMLLAYESLHYHKEASRQITTIPNYFSGKWMPDYLQSGINSFEPEDYQAIIPLPYYLTGSEDYKKSSSNKIYQLSMAIANQTGLPLMANYSTNAGIVESKNLYQILSPVFYTKEIEKDIKDNRPFLLIFSKEELNPAEMGILNRSRRIFDSDGYAMYALSKEMLFVDSSDYMISSFNEHKQQLVEKEGFLVKAGDDDKYLRFYDYDSLQGEHALSGKGSFQGHLKDYNKIATITPSELEPGKTFVISFWIYNDGKNFGQKALDGLAIIELKDASGQVQWPVIVPPASSVNIDGQWTLVEMELNVPDNKSEYAILIKGNDKSDLDIYVDDLLIREKGCDVYKVLNSNNSGITELFYNNHHIRKK